MVSRSLSWTICLGLSSGLLAGTPHAEPWSRAPHAQFAARAEGVLVDVEVTRGGKPVEGLTSADFSLRDDGVLQTIDVARSSNGSVNTVLALDDSDTDPWLGYPLGPGRSPDPPLQALWRAVTTGPR